MFSLFPDLFFLSPLAVALLRIAAGVVFLTIAWDHFSRREQLGEMYFIVVGKGQWIPLVAAIVELVTGLGLVLGIYTQVAAILGAIGALKSLIWKHRYSTFIPLSHTSSALLLAICLSLIFTGAGAFAFDLPL